MEVLMEAEEESHAKTPRRKEDQWMNHRDTETQRRQQEGAEEEQAGRSVFLLLARLLLFFSSLCLCVSVVHPSSLRLGVLACDFLL
jgi:hypothetical protein